MSESTEARIARIDERTELILDALNKFEERMEKHEVRICTLEACQNQTTGRDAAITVFISFLVAIITIGATLYSGIFVLG